MAFRQEKSTWTKLVLSLMVGLVMMATAIYYFFMARDDDGYYVFWICLGFVGLAIVTYTCRQITKFVRVLRLLKSRMEKPTFVQETDEQEETLTDDQEIINPV